MYTIGVVTPSTQADNRDLLLGINAVLVAQGWIMDAIGGTVDLARFQKHPPDALVFHGNTLHLLPASYRAGTPAVATDADHSAVGIPSVRVDDRAVGVEAARHLIDKRLLCLACFGQEREGWTRARIEGFQDAVREAGVPDRAWVRRDDDPSLSFPLWCYPEDVAAWVRSLPKPAGIFACCDPWGQMLLDTCRRHGIRVPEDVAVVGADDDALACELSVPPLSSVAISRRRIGFEAAHLLRKMLAGESVPMTTVLPPGAVIPRRSSDTRVVDDPLVAQALDVIRAHADKPLSVSDILRRVPTYQHRLEKGFKRALGRSMLDEIRRVHVEQAKRLLAMTDLPMSDVAQRSGFPNPTKLGIAFRRETGMTPTGYRRAFGLRAREP